MDLLNVVIMNAIGYWLIVLADQIFQPPYAKITRILVALVVLILLVLSRLR